MNISEIKKLSKRFNDDGWEVKCWVNNNLVYDSENKTKVSHKAPKEIKGDYDLSIHGNKIVLVDNNDGTTVEAKCHPDDDFDIGAGIKEAFRKLNVKREEYRKQKEEEDKKIKVGDWVEVLWDDIFIPYEEKFFEENHLMLYAPRYCYGYIPEQMVTGKVLFMNKYKILIEGFDEYGNNPIYLIDNDCSKLKKVSKPNV